MGNAEEGAESLVDNVGKVIDHVPVSIGPRFLELFSEHLYSSPNKAFEELISNSWDAGATTVYVGVPDNLADESVVVWILDNGESMDIAGLHALWAVATSAKRDSPPANGRPQIGKFGIGKLATYLLANKLTYLCKAQDGIIRAITMDYRRIDTEAAGSLHVEPIDLEVRQLTDADMQELLTQFAPGTEILALIKKGIPKPDIIASEGSEFGAQDTAPALIGGTWTLALLTSLKPAGKNMQTGWLQRLLRTALPLGSSMSIVFNGELLQSTKLDIEIAEEWAIGPGLGIDSIAVEDGKATVRRLVTEHSSPYPHIEIEGLGGAITGRVRLYKERISGGKSDAVAASNGFQVNILGRVINVDDPYFGLENLSHSAWAKFRATVRADNLDEALGVNREDLSRGNVLQTFRAFLRALFNKARVAETALQGTMPTAGEVLTKSWGAIPLQPLSDLIIAGLTGGGALPDFVDSTGITDRDDALRQWQLSATNQPGDLIKSIELDDSIPPDGPLVKYDLASRRVLINKNHPFSREHIEGEERQGLLRDTAFADLLTKARMLDLGIDEALVEEVWQYRDKTLRLLSQINRRTAVQMADMLLKSTGHDKGLETAVSDALESLGFLIERLAKSGEPEGVATAPTPASTEDEASSYSFTYDAKSSISGKVKTANTNIAGLVRHRDKYKAQHILVVAPDYEDGALQDECKKNGVTPMRARDLAELLLLTVSAGPCDLIRLRGVFKLHDPDEVHAWVESYARDARTAPKVSLDVFLAALSKIGFAGPNAITTAVIADRISQLPGIPYYPKRDDIRKLVAGLSVLIPSLIQLSGHDVFITTSPQKVRQAIVAQIAAIPPEYRPDLNIAEQDASE